MNIDLEMKIIACGYRNLAKKLHPDHQGAAESMIQLNAARDRLKSLVYHAIDNPAPTPGATDRQQPAAPPAPSAAHHPEAYRPMTVEDFLTYARQRMEADPLGAGILTIIEAFAKQRKQSKTRRRR